MSIINTKNNKGLIFLYLISLLVLISISEYNDKNTTSDDGTDETISRTDKIRNWISSIYPIFFGMIGLILFFIIDRSHEGGYISLTILIILSSYLSSHTLSQWGLLSEEKEKIPECSFILPSSNQFETKEHYFYKFIYFISIIILSICLTGFEFNYSFLIYLSPFIFPILTELISYATDILHENKEKNNAKLTPELFLIQFLRGKHTGNVDGKTDAPKFKDMNWFVTDEKNPESFINLHLFYSMLFYGMLMWYVIVYSFQFPFGNRIISTTPLYIAITIMIGFPLFMKYIFIQDCAIDEYSDNLPDAIPNSEKKLESVDEREEYETRLEKKQSITCLSEKYGGIQSLVCLSFIILILINIKGGYDKLLTFFVIILLTYGMSQTLYRIKKEEEEEAEK